MSSRNPQPQYIFTHGDTYYGDAYNDSPYYTDSSYHHRTSCSKERPSAREVTCRLWRAGVCRSRACEFAHYHTEYISSPQPYTCWFWAQGHCTETTATCAYTHDFDGLRAQRPRNFGRNRKLLIPDPAICSLTLCGTCSRWSKCRNCIRRKRCWLQRHELASFAKTPGCCQGHASKPYHTSYSCELSPCSIV